MPYRRRKVAGRRRAIKPRTVKAIASRVVKRQLASVIERKRLNLFLPDQTLANAKVYAAPVMTWITAGAGENQRIGDKISDVYLKLRFAYHHVGGANAYWAGSRFRVLVIKTNKSLPAYTVNQWQDATTALPQLFLSPGQSAMSLVNDHDYQVLVDKTVVSEKTLTSQTHGIPRYVTVNLNLAKRFQYMDDLTTMSKNKQIYVVVTASMMGATADICGNLQGSGVVTYHDA